MIWIDNISQLWINRKNPNDPCFCEHIIYPNDMVLQGGLFTNIASGFSVQVLVYSIDGLTQYEDATSYFSFYVGVKPNGGKFFNLRLEAFSPEMCNRACYILRVIVTASGKTLFDKFTEHYCQNSCCDIPRGIGIGTSSLDCPIYLNYIQRIYSYDAATDSLLQLAAGSVEYTDIAVLGNNLYARSQYGDLDVYQINGLSLTYTHTITGLPTGAALGADGVYLYIDDGTNIKRFLPSNPTALSTVVNDSYPVQGDIYIQPDGTIMISVAIATDSVMRVWDNGSLIDSYNIEDASNNNIADVYGMYVYDGDFFILSAAGIIYKQDPSTKKFTQYSTAPQTQHNNTRWNGAAQAFACGEIEVNTPDSEPIPRHNCGAPYLQIKARFECIDNETGAYYGIPSNVLSGSATFAYEKIFNLPATIKREPREINRTISFNCKLQRAESFKPYRLRGQGMDALLPYWKLDELENMLHANYLEINDFGVNIGKMQLQFPGGTIAERVHDCMNVFRVDFLMQSCTFRTDYGCGDCDDSEKVQTFIISKNATTEAFFDENKQEIGDFDDLMGYYESLGFTVIDTSGTIENTSGSFTVQGNGIIPPFYYDYVYQNYLVFPTDTPEAPVIICPQPAFDYAYGIEASCTAMSIDYAYSEDVTPLTVLVTDYSDWSTTGTSDVTETTGKLSLTATNPTITDEHIILAGEPIGIIALPGRPLYAQFIDLGGGQQIAISPSGIVSFYGAPDSVDGTGADITITNVYYSMI